MIKKQQFLTDTENGSIFFPDENKHKLFVVSGDMNKGDFYCESDDYSFVIYVNFIPTVGDYIGGAFGGGQWLWILY